jgi:hypothetical protein
MSRFTSRRPEKPERSKRGAYSQYTQLGHQPERLAIRVWLSSPMVNRWRALTLSKWLLFACL